MYASILLPIPFCRLKGPLTYAVPANTALTPGMVVFAPFGKRMLRGVVTRVDAKLPDGIDVERIRPIASVDASLTLSPERFALAEWMSAYYLAPLLDVLRLFLPGLIWKDGLIPAAHEVVEIVQSPPSGAIDALRRAPKQRSAYEQLAGGSTFPLAAVTGTMEIARETMKLLEGRGLVRIVDEPVPPPQLTVTHATVTGTPAQDAALATALEGIGFRGTLLFGVTGSGKTEVYLRAIADVLTNGKSALYLVPEIALTPQTIARVEARFPGVIAVLHSGMTEHQRAVAWSRVASGHARVLVGPRSALFAPLMDLGLIVIDEEHDGSYKQETAPRYHARAVALRLAEQLQIPVILGSATPSVETFSAAANGIIRRADLPTRVSGTIPAIEVIDLREERKAGNRSIFSQALQDALRETVAAKRQAILFLNRRGFAPTLHCANCGAIEQCDACYLARTLHTRGSSFVLLCHGCGDVRSMPEACTACGGKTLKSLGYGTQRVEAELAKVVPGARIVRADRDTTRGPEAHARIYEQVRSREVDILIGTQMIAKGLDLPAVDLVGILLADIGLAYPDFRAAERSYALLTQVAGRAGRGDQPGRVLLQTYSPDAAVIQAVVRSDAASFLSAEMLLRKTYGYPPAAHLVKLSASMPSAKQAYEHLVLLRDRLAPLAAKQEVTLLGPAPAVFAKRKGLYTYHLLLRAPSRTACSQLLRALPPGVQVDVDPQDTA